MPYYVQPFTWLRFAELFSIEYFTRHVTFCKLAVVYSVCTLKTSLLHVPLDEPTAVQAAQKNLKHFAPLYDKYHAQIFRFIFKRVGDRDQTADITSQVFLKAMLNLKKYEDRGYPFSAWLFRIAVNEVNMFYRSKKKDVHVSISGMELKEILHEMEQDERQVQLQCVVNALNNLPPEKTQMIDLRFFEKCSYREIGEVFGITEANAKMRVRRTLQGLKASILIEKPNEEV